MIVPKVPGTFSALGMLMASWRQDFVRTLYGLLGALGSEEVEAVFAELAEAGRAQLARDGIAQDTADFPFFADLRYVGQEHTIAIPVRDPTCSAATSRRCAPRSTPSTTSATARRRPTSGSRSSMCASS